MKKFISFCLVLTFIICAALPCQAAVLDQEYSPENYQNISGNFFAEDIELTQDADSSCIYKFTLEPGQTVLIEAAVYSPISIQITDSEGRVCMENSDYDSSPHFLCAYTSRDGGVYYAAISSEINCTVDINISFPTLPGTKTGTFPFNAQVQQDDKTTNYAIYSFALKAGDAFSFKCEAAGAYILFDGGNTATGYNMALYDDFRGYCGVVAENCTATVFIPTPCSTTIAADVLPHSAYRIQDVYLPLNDGSLDMSDAAIPFDSVLLSQFTDDFGEDCIDNRPLKFFRFDAQANQIIQLVADTDLFTSCYLVCGIDNISIASGRGRLEILHSYNKNDKTHVNNLLVKSTGPYLLGIQSVESTVSPKLQIFESYSSPDKLQTSYVYGTPIDKPPIQNIFTDTNYKNDTGVSPYISCFKLIDGSGKISYHATDADIKPEPNQSYEMYAVIIDGDISYQVHLGGFNVKNVAAPDTSEPQTDENAPKRSGPTWWMILIIIYVVFCLGCTIFLLVYKKDINDVK